MQTNYQPHRFLELIDDRGDYALVEHFRRNNLLLWVVWSYRRGAYPLPNNWTF